VGFNLTPLRGFAPVATGSPGIFIVQLDADVAFRVRLFRFFGAGFFLEPTHGFAPWALFFAPLRDFAAVATGSRD
jgi:hypothetical protein